MDLSGRVEVHVYRPKRQVCHFPCENLSRTRLSRSVKILRDYGHTQAGAADSGASPQRVHLGSVLQYRVSLYRAQSAKALPLNQLWRGGSTSSAMDLPVW